MARVKVRLADNIARVVFVETEATPGATLGTDLRLPDGSVATPAALTAWLGVSNAGSGGVTNHRLLNGLTLGNDHPQYVLKSVLTANGDLLVRASGIPARLAIGDEGDVLMVVGGVPTWYPMPSGGAGVHDEPLTDGLGGFVFDGTDIVVVVGVPN